MYMINDWNNVLKFNKDRPEILRNYLEQAALFWYSISKEKNRLYIYLHKRIATCIFKVHWFIPFRKNWRFCQYWIDCIMIPSTSVSVNRFLSANVMPDYFLYKNIHICTSDIKPIKQWICWYWLFMNIGYMYVWSPISLIFWMNSIKWSFYWKTWSSVDKNILSKYVTLNWTDHSRNIVGSRLFLDHDRR